MLVGCHVAVVQNCDVVILIVLFLNNRGINQQQRGRTGPNNYSGRSWTRGI